MSLVDSTGRVLKMPSQSQFKTRDLIRMFNESMQLKDGRLLGYLLRSKIHEFQKNNHLRYKTAHEKIALLAESYFEMVEDATQPRGLAIKMDGEGKDAKAVLLEGKTMEAYQIDLNAILDEPNIINL